MSAAERNRHLRSTAVLRVGVSVLVVLLSACSGRALRGAGVEASTAPTSAAERAALDPWESTNRKVHNFNRKLDRRVMKPVARGYVKAVPRPVRQGVTNLFDNLQEPIVALNLLVQGHGQKATESGFRFLLNSTIGLAGIFDVASAGKVPEYRADFGQTFALWGWQRSRYVVLPVFGPASVRDGFARVVNSQVSPINTVGTRKLGPGAGVLYGITSRAAALPNEAFAENAADEYLLLRDVYFQRRGCQIRDCSQEVPDYELPDELGVPASDITPDNGP